MPTSTDPEIPTSGVGPSIGPIEGRPFTLTEPSTDTSGAGATEGTTDGSIDGTIDGSIPCFVEPAEARATVGPPPAEPLADPLADTCRVEIGAAVVSSGRRAYPLPTTIESWFESRRPLPLCARRRPPHRVRALPARC
eukprot:6446533-Prymnesium_polylepis.1